MSVKEKAHNKVSESVTLASTDRSHPLDNNNSKQQQQQQQDITKLLKDRRHHSRMLQGSSGVDSAQTINDGPVNNNSDSNHHQRNYRRASWRREQWNCRGDRRNNDNSNINNNNWRYRENCQTDQEISANVRGLSINDNSQRNQFRRNVPPRHRNGGQQNRTEIPQNEVTNELHPHLRDATTSSRSPQENFHQRGGGRRRFQSENFRRSENCIQNEQQQQQSESSLNVQSHHHHHHSLAYEQQAEQNNGRNYGNGQNFHRMAERSNEGNYNTNWQRQPNRGNVNGRGFGRGRWRGNGGREQALREGQQRPTESSTTNAQNAKVNCSSHEVTKGQQISECSKKEEVTKEELHQLRTTEINLFKKRFPKSNEIDEETFEFMFRPTDPDWPFDVRELLLKMHVPKSYPSDQLKIIVLNPDDVLPSLLVKDIDSAIEKWILWFHKEGQLSFRPFLRWIDRNLQEIFVESLRKIKRLQERPVVVLVDLEKAQSSINHPENETNSVDDSTKQQEETEQKDEPPLKVLPKKHERLLDFDEAFDSVGPTKSEHVTRVAHQGAVGSNQLSKILNNYDPQSAARKGIEIKFRHVDLSESVSFLICDRLLVSVQCKKCKKIADFQLLPGRRSVSCCAKCQTKLEACFRPCILLQFNPVLGYLELQECTIRDVALPRCHFYADCQGCSKLSPLEGMHLSQRASTNCMVCNVKMQLLVDSIKYMDMCAIEANIKASHMKKANKDSSIQAGKPLPNKGICKHYKKSFRWFRFPCCGKAYPCDDCHNEQETDHTAEFASRMICGFCAKEQPFSNDKPCSQCSNLITGKRTAHWEGGKGCRNKTKMSTNDAKKYNGLNKTISRKSTAVKSK